MTTKQELQFLNINKEGFKMGCKKKGKGKGK